MDRRNKKRKYYGLEDCRRAWSVTDMDALRSLRTRATPHPICMGLHACGPWALTSDGPVGCTVSCNNAKSNKPLYEDFCVEIIISILKSIINALS